MAKDIQIKHLDNEQYVDLYPKTKAELVEGLSQMFADHNDDPEAHPFIMGQINLYSTYIDMNTQDILDIRQNVLPSKVDKVEGKGLSTEDFTTAEKNKLAGAEVTANKGQANGYAPLDGNSKVPLANLPDLSKVQRYFVASIAERDALTGLVAGDSVYITAGTNKGDSYVWNGSEWLLLADADWENINLQWSNIIGRPSSTVANIDQAVTQRHTHSNKSAIDKIRDTGSESTYDLASFAKLSDLEDLGAGDMLKSVYDTNNNGKVDVADLADSVPWTGVSGKPSTFPPSTHDHPASQITESTSRRFVSDSKIAEWDGKSKFAVSATQPTGNVDLWFQVLS